ncbi:MAG: hypothetical protein KJ811_05745, partial [Candidatus Margulisbacteria bacterium]|nr:hypothetical protein [Candidatus Margulisiibacteriota bacterium]
MDRAQSLAQANARLAAAFKINRPTQKTPLCSIMQRLTKVPLLSNYFQNEQGITGIDNITNQLNTLFNQLNLLAQQSMMMIDIQSNNNSAGVIAQAKEIIVSFLKEKALRAIEWVKMAQFKEPPTYTLRFSALNILRLSIHKTCVESLV